MSKAELLLATLSREVPEKHTGPVIIHFAQGKPNAIEIPAPSIKIALKALDSRVCLAALLTR